MKYQTLSNWLRHELILLHSRILVDFDVIKIALEFSNYAFDSTGEIPFIPSTIAIHSRTTTGKYQVYRTIPTNSQSLKAHPLNHRI